MRLAQHGPDFDPGDGWRTFIALVAVAMIAPMLLAALARCS